MAGIFTCKPRVWPMVIVGWIAGLSMRDYIRRHFPLNMKKEKHLIQKTIEYIRRTSVTALRQGSLEVSSCIIKSRANLVITLRGHVDTLFLPRVTRRFKRLLHKSTVTLTLHIDRIYEDQYQQLGQMLQRLADYGDRISLRVSKSIKPVLPVDFSRFHVVVE